MLTLVLPALPINLGGIAMEDILIMALGKVARAPISSLCSSIEEKRKKMYMRKMHHSSVGSCGG